LREIEARVAQSIARYGVAGKVRIEGDQVVLEGSDPPAATEIGDLAAQWAELAVVERQRRIAALARTLVVARGVQRKSRPRRAARSWLGAIVIAGSALVAWLFVRQQRGGEPVPVAPLAAVADDELAEIEKRGCDAASERADRGQMPSAAQAGGWVVELSLLRRGDPNVVFDPGLLAFVQRAPGRLHGRFVWAGAREISSLDGAGTEVEVVESSERGLSGARLLFKGRYVEPYFSPGQRAAFERTASAIADRLAATHAGLYARCAHRPLRHAGAWFRGPGAAGSATSLVHFMAPPKEGFESIERRAKSVAPSQLAAWTRPYRAQIEDGAHPFTTVRFPFDDPTLARKAGLEIARELPLAGDP
jgi:hypothetical protein